MVSKVARYRDGATIMPCEQCRARMRCPISKEESHNPSSCAMGYSIKCMRPKRGDNPEGDKEEGGPQVPEAWTCPDNGESQGGCGTAFWQPPKSAVSPKSRCYLGGCGINGRIAVYGTYIPLHSGDSAGPRRSVWRSIIRVAIAMILRTHLVGVSEGDTRSFWERVNAVHGCDAFEKASRTTIELGRHVLPPVEFVSADTLAPYAFVRWFTERPGGCPTWSFLCATWRTPWCVSEEVAWAGRLRLCCTTISRISLSLLNTLHRSIPHT